ncbi:MAG: PTS sugar transporter subunit IIB [Tissierellia bacterium]|nr:PTS sugar transporter subunit IIB [Tissierellia bacterium]
MLEIKTVCGNGIGSSLMLKMKIEQLCNENNIEANVESIDSNAAMGANADVFITVKEFVSIFDKGQKVLVVRSYMNKKKIKEDVLDDLIEISKKLGG